MPTKSVSHKSRPYRHFMGTNHSHRCPLFAPVWRDSRWDGITPPYLQKQPPSEQVPTFFFSVGYAFNRKDYRYHFLSSERASIANGLSVALPPTADAAGWAEAQTHFRNGGTSLMGTKQRRLSIKLTQEDFDKIHRKAEQSNKNVTDYVTTTCLGKEITIITDLAEVLKELKAVGRNLNQIAVLAHSGRITAINLSGVQEEMVIINQHLKEILERRRWSA